MAKFRKFGEKSADKQTVFVVEHENITTKENGVLTVFDNLEDAESFIRQSVKDDSYYGWEVNYIISQHDINK